jgi:hypothetical protein
LKLCNGQARLPGFHLSVVLGQVSLFLYLAQCFSAEKVLLLEQQEEQASPEE